jgi:hypothetical protein
MRPWKILYSFDGSKFHETIFARSKRHAKRLFADRLAGRWNVEILDVWS